MESADVNVYETPRVIVSLDALGMIADADGMAVGTTGSVHELHEAPASSHRNAGLSKV